MLKRANKWLETNWVAPAYAGWLLAILTICFFGAATNTMAGWLYVLSGVGVALLGVGAILPSRSIQALAIRRTAILPVTAGTDLEIEIAIGNPTNQIHSLFQIRDLNALAPVDSPLKTIEQVLPQNEYRWIYRQPTTRRGVYRWDKVALRSGAPIGLFWCQRYRQAPAIAYVYPPALPLDRCLLLDGMGSSDRDRQQQFANRQLESASEGITRSLRPYRYGDAIRSIHWRTSARYGIFQVRELEIELGGQDVTICLDSSANWDAADFEQAVIAACSLYFYANRFANLNVKLWTAATGIVVGDRQVLETLAAVQIREPSPTQPAPFPQMLLTSQPQRVETIPTGNRWLLWTHERFTPTPHGSPGIKIDPQQSLQQQLNRSSTNTNTRSIPLDDRSPLAQNPDLN